MHYYAVILSSLLVLILSASAQASSPRSKHMTLATSDRILFKVGDFSSVQQAQNACEIATHKAQANLSDARAKLPSLTPDLDVTVVAEILQRMPFYVGPRPNPSGPIDMIYSCDLAIKSKRSLFTLRKSEFKIIQDNACEETFRDLFDSKNIVISKTFERTTFWKRQQSCLTQYVEIIRR